MEAILVLIATFVVFYFLLIRPQQKRSKQHQELLKAVEPGDEIVTIGGLYGDVVEVDEKSVLLEVYDGTQMRFMRSAVSRKVEPEESPEGYGEAAEVSEEIEAVDDVEGGADSASVESWGEGAENSPDAETPDDESPQDEASDEETSGVEATVGEDTDEGRE